MSGGGAGGSRTTIAPTGTIDAMAMTTGDIVAIERATATMADVMRAVTVGGDAVGIATTIDPEGPESNHHSGTKEPAVSAGFLLARSARGRDARGVGLEDCRKDSIDGMIGAWSFNVRAMSALPSTSDLRRRTLKVRFVPNADVSRCSKRCREVRSYSITRSAGARGQAEKPHRGWLWGMPIGTRRIGRALLGAGLDGL